MLKDWPHCIGHHLQWMACVQVPHPCSDHEGPYVLMALQFDKPTSLAPVAEWCPT